MSKKKDEKVLASLDEATPPNFGLSVNVDVNQLLTELTEDQVYLFLGNLKDLLRG